MQKTCTLLELALRMSVAAGCMVKNVYFEETASSLVLAFRTYIHTYEYLYVNQDLARQKVGARLVIQGLL